MLLTGTNITGSADVLKKNTGGSPLSQSPKSKTGDKRENQATTYC